MKIDDGTGNGTQAEVNIDNKLETCAVTTTGIAEASQTREKAFEFATPLLTVTATEGLMLYMKNTSTVLFHVHSFLFSWDGGSTNFNRNCVARLYFKTSAPSANNTSATPINLFIGSGGVASADFEYWDEVGTGITVSSNGVLAPTLQITQGTFEFVLGGVILIPPDQSLGVTLQGQEVGEAAVSMQGFYLNGN